MRRSAKRRERIAGGLDRALPEEPEVGGHEASALTPPDYGSSRAPGNDEPQLSQAFQEALAAGFDQGKDVDHESRLWRWMARQTRSNVARRRSVVQARPP
jgi:hypothetical protein